jgi:hypothetical protein
LHDNKKEVNSQSFIAVLVQIQFICDWQKAHNNTGLRENFLPLKIKK